MGTNVARVVLWIQGAATVLGAALALLLALLTLVTGPQWMSVAAVFAGVGLGLIAAALILAWVGYKLTSSPNGWRFAAYAIALCLVPVGVAMLAIVPPSSAPTEGPFVDGGNGVIALAGFGYATGGVVVMLALTAADCWALVRKMRRPRT